MDKQEKIRLILDKVEWICLAKSLADYCIETKHSNSSSFIVLPARCKQELIDLLEDIL